MLPDVIRHLLYPLRAQLRLHIQSLADFAKNYYPIIAVLEKCASGQFGMLKPDWLTSPKLRSILAPVRHSTSSWPILSVLWFQSAA